MTASAWLLATVLLSSAIVVGGLVFRAYSRLETNERVQERLSKLEAEIGSCTDLVDRLSKRWSKRERDRKAKMVDPADPTQTPTNGDDVLRQYDAIHNQK